MQLNKIAQLIFVGAILVVTKLQCKSAVVLSDFQDISPPGQTISRAFGIDGTNIVGLYSSGLGQPNHGYLYNGVSYTTIDYPTAAYTMAFDIANDRVVGTYGDGTREHGFLLQSGSYTSLDPVGSTNTRIWAIDGNMLGGEFIDSGSLKHGFLYDLNTSIFTTFDKPGATQTNVNAISGGTIAGNYWDGTGLHGYVYQNSVFIELADLDKPNTQVYGVQGNWVTGFYNDGFEHAFVYDLTTSSYTIVDYPGAQETELFKIDSGVAVGFYGPSSYSPQSSFTVAVAPEPSRGVLLLLGGMSLLLKRRRISRSSL